MRSKRRSFPGRLLVVGGQSRNVGKTALVVDLIRAVPEAKWTAVKITPYSESGCPVAGASCRCKARKHTYVIREERDRRGASDTSRFLAAGAVRALWVQTKEGRLADALVPLAKSLADARNVVIESNAIVRFWPQDMFILALDPSKGDFKLSAQKVLRRADAFVLRSPMAAGDAASRRASRLSSKPQFLQALGKRLPVGLKRLVRQRFGAAQHHG